MPKLDSPLQDEQSDPPKRSGLLIFLPLIILGLLAALFIWGLEFNPNGPKFIPSALIGKKVADFKLAPMDGLFKNGKQMPSFGSDTLKQGKVSIINVWASWCVSCRAEHHFLKRLAKRSGVPIYGFNYKDTASAGRGFLARFGNPYSAVGMDPRGRVGIDFGVYGVPETFIVDGKGIIRYKIPGPVNDQIIEERLLPAIEKARKQ